MRAASLFSFVLLTLLLGGCVRPLSHKPIGLAPAAVKPEEWEGTWFGEDEDGDAGTRAFTITVDDAQKGKGRLEVSDDGTTKCLTIYLRTAAFADPSVLFANGTNPEDPTSVFLWVLVAKRGTDEIVLRAQNLDVLRGAVREGVLPGEIGESYVCLNELTDEQMKFVCSEAGRGLYAWDEKVVFKRTQKRSAPRPAQSGPPKP
jgi:hypothetical protein